MAAHLLSLRLRLLIGSMRQSPWTIVALVVTVLGAISLLATTLLGAIAIRALVPELGADAAVVAGAVLVLGLTAVTVLIGTSDPLATERFSVLPVRVGPLRRGLLVSSVLDAWVVVGVLGTVIGVVVWSTSAAAIIAAIVALPLTAATAVLVPRAVADLLARQLASRSARDVMAVLLLVGIAGLAIGVQLLAGGVRSIDDLADVLAAAAGTLAWTPIGAAFDLPRAVAAGAWAELAAKLAIALATVLLAWWGWGRLLAERLTNPIVLRGSGQVREGGLLDRLLPATPVGAIATRSIRYRRRDVRHLMNVLAALMLPAVVGGVQLSGVVEVGADGTRLPLDGLALLPVLLGYVAAAMVQIDLAYDSSAFAWHLITGVRGAHDRAGRLAGIAVVYVPTLVLTALLATWASGRWELLPAAVGGGLGTFLLLAGFMLWLGVLLPGEAPAPGSNPLGRGSSGAIQSLAGIALSLPVLCTVGAPCIVLAAAAIWLPWLGWLSLGVGLVVGGLAAWFGIGVGGAALDRRGPEVLAQVSKPE